MKLASVRWRGRHVLAAGSKDRLVDLGAAIEDVAPGSGIRTVLDLIDRGPEGLALARCALDSVSGSAEEHVALNEVSWEAPVRRPGKIVCLALNNSANPQRIMSGPSHPASFVKPASALVGHGGAIECRPGYGRTHPEPELAVVMGKRAKNIRPEQSLDHIFGYTIHNDITSATMRGEDTFHFRAIHPSKESAQQIEYVDSWVSYSGRYKCADTFAPMGPWLVTADEVPDPHALDVECHHDGRLVLRDNTANLTHRIPDVIAFISGYMTLDAGDVISMGTALRQGNEGTPIQNVNLHASGGSISVSIERLGTLVNPVARV